MSKRTGTERKAARAQTGGACVSRLERPVGGIEGGLAVTVIVQCPGHGNLDGVLARLIEDRDLVAGTSAEDAARRETPVARPERKTVDVGARDAPRSPLPRSVGSPAPRQERRSAPRTTPTERGCATPAAAAQPFDGGELVFYPDRLELRGVRILGDTGLGHSRRMLELLRRRRSDGRFVRMGGEELARRLGEEVGAPITIGTVTGCARTLRENIRRRLRRHLDITCDDHDVLAHDDQGYHLNDDKVVVRDGTDGGDNNSVPSNVPGDKADVPDVPSDVPGDTSLNERQTWIVAQINKGAEVRRRAVEEKFGVSAKTAKRDFSELVKRGLVEYVSRPQPGFYRRR